MIWLFRNWVIGKRLNGDLFKKGKIWWKFQIKYSPIQGNVFSNYAWPNAHSYKYITRSYHKGRRGCNRKPYTNFSHFSSFRANTSYILQPFPRRFKHSIIFLRFPGGNPKPYTSQIMPRTFQPSCNGLVKITKFKLLSHDV